MSIDAIDYSEVEGDPSEGAVLEALAKGNPHLFLVVTDGTEADGFGVRLAVGGGLEDNRTIRSLLRKVMEAIPE